MDEKHYDAPFDIVGNTISDHFSGRLVPSISRIKQVGNNFLMILDNLELKVEGYSPVKEIVVRVISGCTYNTNLGHDFVRLLKLKCDDERGICKGSNKGEWHKFSN